MHGATAVVLGGSVAGLCSAGVLAPHFDRVVVLERDELPPGAEHRRGVPQSKHPHFVLNAGRRAIGTIFPGFEESLIEAGGMLLMPSMDAAYGEMDGWGPRKTSTMTMIYSSRILIERVLREKVRDLPTIEIREGVTASGLSTTGGGTPAGRVTGVEYRDAHGETRILEADLVVDALGRGSSVRDWLAAAGWPAVPEKTLDAKVTYTSRWYQLPDASQRPPNWWWQHVVLTPTQDTGPHPREHEFLSNFFPVEGDRAIACMGSWGSGCRARPRRSRPPPTDSARPPSPPPCGPAPRSRRCTSPAPRATSGAATTSWHTHRWAWWPSGTRPAPSTRSTPRA